MNHTHQRQCAWLRLGFAQWSMALMLWTTSGALCQAQQDVIRGAFSEPLINDSGQSSGNDLLLRPLVERSITDRATQNINLEQLNRFARDNPRSGWRVSLWTNLGIESYQQGRFSQCLDFWPKAWEAGRDSANPKVRALADRSFAEWMKMLSRLGRVTELRAGLVSVEGLNFGGMVAEMVQVARDALWVMENNPEISFRCGPHALQRILTYTNAANQWPLEITRSESPPGGIPLVDVAALSAQIGMNYQMAKRISPSAEIPVPAVVHWKLDHYGAVVKKENTRYLLDDPTFGNGLIWIEEAVLKAESSGYFLLPPGPLPPGWVPVDASEGSRVVGRGYPNSNKPGAVGPGNPGGGSDKLPGTPPDDSCKGGKGMAVWDVTLMMASLNITDSPTGYTPPAGPPVHFTVVYNQRETNQPAVPDYANFGPLWNCDWIGSLTFDSTTAYFNRGQGGIETFTDFNVATQSYAPGYLLSNRLVKISATYYELRRPDGGKLVFALPNHPTTPTRIFMTQVVDPQGNAATLTYDGTFRLTAITDAIDQTSTLTYGTAAEALLVKRITDPFGRFASFDYNPNGRLIKITDVIGLTSEFTYDGQDKLLTLSTGYGVTSFVYGTVNANRSVQITHPNGDEERFEQRQGSTPGVAFSEPASVVPQGMPVFNQYMDGRNTFHWDRKAFKDAPGDYSRARLYHFMHHALSISSPLLESYKLPNENRVWLMYQGQSGGGFYSEGMIGSAPDRVARVLDDGSTQLSRASYNATGLPTQTMDPLDRTVIRAYDPNGLDVVEIRRKTSATASERLAAITYDNRHLPLSITDAAGQTTTSTYNAHGQVLTVTNAKSEVTAFNYNASGYLTSVDGPLPGSTDSITFTYDAFGRVRTITDTEGYAITKDYDALNRVTRVTYPDATYQEATWSLLDVTAARDRRGRITSYEHDSLRQLVKETDPLSRVTRYAWCRCGAMKSLIDPMGRETRWEFDLQGRKTAKVYPDNSRVTYAYETASSRLKSVTDAKGQTRHFDYYLDDQLRSQTYFNALNPTPGVAWTYDPQRGRILTRLDGTGLTRYYYHPITAAPAPGAGKLSKIDGPLANDDIIYAYDEIGRVLSRSIGGVAQSVVYDALGRVTNTSNALGAFTHGYVNATGRLASVNYPNGQTTALDYFPNSGDQRLKEIWHKRPGGATLSKFNYTYDLEGQIQTWSQQSDSQPAREWSYGYDLADQLTSAAATNPSAIFGYSYDPAGNRLTETINGVTSDTEYNHLNELVNRTGVATAARSYEWDAENRLVAIVTGTHRSEFTFDGLHRRVRIVEKDNNVTTSDHRFVWCGMTLCEERNATGTAVTKRFLPQGVVDAGTALFYTRDHLGSVREMMDGAGILGARYDYDPYGRRSKITGALESDFGFTGHYLHQASGLHLAPFRAYQAEFGRWTSRDRIEERGGINLYAYTGNEPIHRYDPLGLEPGYLGKRGHEIPDSHDGFNPLDPGWVIEFQVRQVISAYKRTILNREGDLADLMAKLKDEKCKSQAIIEIQIEDLEREIDELYKKLGKVEDNYQKWLGSDYDLIGERKVFRPISLNAYPYTPK